MKKLILKRRTIEVVPYNHDVTVILTTDIKRAVLKLKGELGDDIITCIKPNMHALTVFSDGNSNIFIFLEMKPDVGTLVHEVYHAVDFILRDAGVKNDPHVNDETWAYHLGDLTRQVVKFYHHANSKGKFSTNNRAKT